jgi:ABC-2 type transport system ATP-binding protein
MSDPSPAIEVRELTKTYRGGVRAIDKIGFAVPAGTVFGLLGPNGAGKSTTMKILTTLTRPDSGTARVAGVDVVRSPAEVRRLIGCVAQQPGVDPVDTGRENLTLQGRLHGMSGRALRARVDELLERLALTEEAHRPAQTYSGGMARKLDIAMGLVHRPRVLFMDEPTTGLDPEARVEVWTQIAGMTAQGITVVLSTHYLHEADELADNLVILDHGQVVAAGTPGRLKEELHADTIHVELADTLEEFDAEGALAHLPGVYDIVVSGHELSARIEKSAANAPAVFAALQSAGLKVSSVRLSAPTLDDVYLRHAGRSYNSAQVVSR